MGRRVYPLPPWWRIVEPLEDALDGVPDDHDLGRSELDLERLAGDEMEPLIEAQWDEWREDHR
jgi:hypothetical protein